MASSSQYPYPTIEVMFLFLIITCAQHLVVGPFPLGTGQEDVPVVAQDLLLALARTG